MQERERAKSAASADEDRQALLASADAIQLGCALVSHIGASSDIRVLLVKGLIAERHQLRAPRPYADIDVLVDPARFDDLVRILEEHGWRERAHLWIFDRIEEHSMTLIHPSWPVDIDLHRYFPGFLLPAGRVFDVLWTHRNVISIAGQPCVGTDRTAAAAILALHSLRHMQNPRSRTEYNYLVETLGEIPEAGTELAILAAATGSSETLRSFIDAIGATPVDGPPVHTTALKAWKRRVSHPSRTGQWFSYLLTLPFSRWPRELRLMVWPPAELFLQEHAAVPRTRRALFAARARRLIAGLVSLPRVFIAGFGRN